MIYLTMMIFVQEGKEEVFHQFEALALPILKDYSGTLIYRLRPTKENYIKHEGDVPYEIHFISFNSEQHFTDFVKDERRKEFLHLKEDSIKSSFLIKGTKL